MIARNRRRWPPWLAVVLLLGAGVVVFFPALRSPPFMDDYFQNAMIDGAYPSPRSPWNLYDFVGDGDRTLLLHRGLIPWWSHPRLTLRFLRPLSSALLWADHRVFGEQPFAFHMHSFAWWVVAALAARSLYRRSLRPRAALLATVVFALAPCHVLPLFWLANRTALVSLVFGVLGLATLARFRERRRWRHLAGATAFFALALMGGEYALAFGGYVLAMAIVGRRWGRLERACAVASFALPAVAYLAVRTALGYAAVGSGVYFDPLRDQAALLRHAPGRLLTLLAQGWLSLDPATVNESMSLWILGLLTVAAASILVVPLRRALASLDEARRECATWFLLGSVLSLVPVLAVAAAPRVLGASMLGIAYAVGLVLERVWFPREGGTEARVGDWEGLVALGIGFAHLVHGPAIARITSSVCRAQATAFAGRAADFRARLGPAIRADVVVVRSLDPTLFVIPWALDPTANPPARWHVLDVAGHVLVSRPDARTLDVVVQAGESLVPPGENGLFRGEQPPFTRGQVVRCGDMRVTVLDVDRAGPRRVRFEFDSDLESPSHAWVDDRLDGVRQARLPAPGYGKTFDP